MVRAKSNPSISAPSKHDAVEDKHKDRNRQMQIMIYDQRKSGGSSGHQLVGKNKHDDSQCHGGVAKENHEKIFWPKNIGFHGFDTLL